MQKHYYKVHYGYWLGLIIAILLTFSVSFASTLDEEKGEKTQKKFQPNIIYLMADDLGYNDLSPEFMPRSYELMKTRGTQIPFYSMQNCAPTRAAFMTGKLPAELGITGVDTITQFKGIDPLEVSLGERMQAAGYKTGIFGKWHMGFEKQQNPLNNGFDEYVGFIHGLINYYGPQKNGEPYPDGSIGHDHHGAHDFQKNGHPFYSPQYSTFAFSDATRDFIKLSAKDSRPYFAYVPFNAPHTPYSAPREYVELYQDRFGVTDNEMSFLYEYAETVLAIPRDTDIDDNLNRKLSELLYYASVRAMDDAIADIYEAVIDSGEAHKTFFMFASDNGAGLHGNLFGDNGELRGGKGMPYEGGHKVANFVIFPPQIQPGQKVFINVWVGDLYETFLTLAKVKLDDKNIQSTNILAPMFHGAKNFRRKHGQQHIINHVSKTKKDGYILAIWGINDLHMKYILKIKMDEEGRKINSYSQELYDLSTDPSELKNLKNNSQYADELLTMQRKFINFGGFKKIRSLKTTENQPDQDFEFPEEWGFPGESFSDNEKIFSERY